MTFTGRYEVTRDLQDQMMRQFFFGVMLRPRIWSIIASFAVLVGLDVIGSSLVSDPLYRNWMHGFISAVSILIALMWMRTFFQARAQGRAGLKLMEHPNVEVTLAEDQIIYVSSTGTRQHSWTKIERLEETKDFIVLMSGPTPLLMLPKAAFSVEALAFFRTRCRKPPTK